MSINQAIKAIENFQGNSLTESLSEIESTIVGFDAVNSHAFCEERKIDQEFMGSALSIKNMAGQINVVIHAAVNKWGHKQMGSSLWLTHVVN